MITKQKFAEICKERKVIPIYLFDDYLINKKGGLFHINMENGNIVSIDEFIFEFTNKGIPVYRIVDLKDMERTLELRLDKLVLNTYIGDLEGKIIHKDEDYKNCSLRNVKYELDITRSENKEIVIINNKEFRRINMKQNKDNRYYISNDGIVYDYFFCKMVIKSLCELYYQVILFDDMDCKVHRLVYMTWVKNIKKGMSINHKDGIKFNNHYTNLELITRSENIRHAHNEGLRPNARWTEDNIHLICKSLEANNSFKVICQKLKIEDNAIRTLLKKLIVVIIKGGVWKDISKKYKVENFNDITVMSKLSDDNVHEICRMMDNGITILEIYKTTKVSKALLKGISSGRIYKDIGSRYKFMYRKKRK